MGFLINWILSWIDVKSCDEIEDESDSEPEKINDTFEFIDISDQENDFFKDR